MEAETGQKLRVLVVDDEPNIADVISMALRFEGFAVQIAANGTEALEGVRSFQPHLMLLDIMLPTWKASRWRAASAPIAPGSRSSS